MIFLAHVDELVWKWAENHFLTFKYSLKHFLESTIFGNGTFYLKARGAHIWMRTLGCEKEAGTWLARGKCYIPKNPSTLCRMY